MSGFAISVRKDQVTIGFRSNTPEGLSVLQRMAELYKYKPHQPDNKTVDCTFSLWAGTKPKKKGQRSFNLVYFNGGQLSRSLSLKETFVPLQRRFLDMTSQRDVFILLGSLIQKDEEFYLALPDENSESSAESIYIDETGEFLNFPRGHIKGIVLPTSRPEPQTTGAKCSELLRCCKSLTAFYINQVVEFSKNIPIVEPGQAQEILRNSEPVASVLDVLFSQDAEQI